MIHLSAPTPFPFFCAGLLGFGIFVSVTYHAQAQVQGQGQAHFDPASYPPCLSTLHIVVSPTADGLCPEGSLSSCSQASTLPSACSCLAPQVIEVPCLTYRHPIQ